MCVECDKLKMLVVCQTSLSICHCTICTFVMYLESVNFIFTYELYIKIDMLKYMNIYCSQSTGLQLCFFFYTFSIDIFYCTLYCMLWYSSMSQLFSCFLDSSCNDGFFFILFPSTFIVFNYVPELVKLSLLTMGTLEMATIAFPWSIRQEVHCFFKKNSQMFLRADYKHVNLRNQYFPSSLSVVLLLSNFCLHLTGNKSLCQ